MKKKNIFIQLGIILGIILILNLIASQLYFRLDFTADKRYTLSEATKDILEDLDELVTVRAYFSEDLPPQLLNNKQDFEDLLIEYESRSNGNIVYEFINPNGDEEIEQEAAQNGINPIIISVSEQDQVQQLKAFMGAVITRGDNKEIIPVIQPGASLEYDLTTSIKKVSVSEKPKVALLTGHGEASLASIFQLHQQLSVLYDVEELNLTFKEDIPSFYKTAVIVNPTDTIPESHLALYDKYLNGGGSIFVAYSTVVGNLGNQGPPSITAAPKIGMQKWLASKGVDMTSNVVIDAKCNSVSVQQNNGMFRFNTQIEFPYFPLLSSFNEHPVTKGLESVFLPFTNSVESVVSDSAVHVTKLLVSSETSGTETTPVYINIQKKWNKSSFTDPNKVVALALEGPISGPTNSKLIVVANGAFFTNGEGQQRQQVNADNVNFAANAIDWLSDDTGLIDLRTKGVTNRPIDDIEDATRNMLKYGNVFIPIFLVLIYAFIRRQSNARRKQKWMQGQF